VAVLHKLNPLTSDTSSDEWNTFRVDSGIRLSLPNGPTRCGETMDALKWTRAGRVTVYDHPPLVVLEGVIDLATKPSLDGALSELERLNAPDVLVDIRDVTLLTAAGLGFLAVASARCADRGGGLYVGVQPGCAHRALVLTGLDAAMTIQVGSPSLPARGTRGHRREIVEAGGEDGPASQDYAG